MARPLRLTLAVRRGDDQPVHFKVDGARFQAEKTIKLSLNTDYALTLTLKPAIPLQGLTIQGEKVPVQAGEQNDHQATYNALWTSAGLGLDKSGKRQQVTLLLQLDSGVTAKLSLQCKFYAQTEKTHSRWGTPLSHIGYDCQIPEGATYLDVLKETFR